MMSWLNDMLSEKAGVSSMRVMALVSLIFGGIIALFGMHKGLPLSEVAMLAGVFVGAAFGGKVAQKAQEAKVEVAQAEPAKPNQKRAETRSEDPPPQP